MQKSLPFAAPEAYPLAKPAEIIADLKAGKMVIITDDEDRENEGDLIIAAEFATAEAVNFMAKFGRGLICLALESAQVRKLGLPLVLSETGSGRSTAFTVSIEAREGITTGISAADRATTIAAAIQPDATPNHISTPGHVFPLMARDGGTLVRAGHTEAAVDLARAAGLIPAGVICEIMNDDGTMARLPDLIGFAQFHNLKVGTIADLIAYRRQHEKQIELLLTQPLQSQFGGDWTLKLYANRVSYAEHVVLIKGDISGDEPVHVRMHALSILGDMLGDIHSAASGSLQAAMAQIDAIGRGVIVLIRESNPRALSERLINRQNNTAGQNETQLRDYGIGAQILTDLGVHAMILLSNHHRPIAGLEGYGLKVLGWESLQTSIA